MLFGNVDRRILKLQTCKKGSSGANVLICVFVTRKLRINGSGAVVRMVPMGGVSMHSIVRSKSTKEQMDPLDYLVCYRQTSGFILPWLTLAETGLGHIFKNTSIKSAVWWLILK